MSAYSQITLKVPISIRSPKLSSKEPVQFLDGWPFSNGRYREQAKTHIANSEKLRNITSSQLKSGKGLQNSFEKEILILCIWNICIFHTLLRLEIPVCSIIDQYLREEEMGFHQINKVKQQRACSILRWVTIHDRYCKQSAVRVSD